MITDLYNAIISTMTARGVTASVVIGLDKQAENDDCPKILFYPAAEVFDRGVMNPGGNPKTLVDRWVEHHAHIWATTIDEMDELISQVVTCVHVTLKAALPNASPGQRAGVYKLGAGTWVLDTRDTNRGYEYDFSFSVPFPILNRTWLPPDVAQVDYADPTVEVTPVVSTVNELIDGDIVQTVTITDPNP